HSVESNIFLEAGGQQFYLVVVSYEYLYSLLPIFGMFPSWLSERGLNARVWFLSSQTFDYRFPRISAVPVISHPGPFQVPALVSVERVQVVRLSEVARAAIRKCNSCQFLYLNNSSSYLNNSPFHLALVLAQGLCPQGVVPTKARPGYESYLVHEYE